MASVDQPSYLGFYSDVRIYDLRRPGEVTVFRHPDFPFVSGVTITRATVDDTYGTATISIDAPFVEGQKMLNSTLFANGNAVEVLLGYPDGQVSPVWFGFLHDGGNGLEITPQGLSGSVTANIVSEAMQDNFLLRGESVAQAFVAAYESVGRKIVFGPAMKAKLEALGEEKLTGYSSIVKLQQEMTDRFGIQASIENKRDEQTISEAEDKAARMSKTVVRSFIMRGQFNEDEGVYPIFSYGPEKNEMRFAFGLTPPGKRGVYTAGVGKDGKCAMAKAVPATESDLPSGVDAGSTDDPGEKSAPSGEAATENRLSFRKPVEGKVVPTWFPDGFSADKSLGYTQTTINELLKVEGDSAGYDASVVTVGIPELELFEMCYVGGIGSLFNGNYQILGFTHTMTATSFQTTLQVHLHKLRTSVPSTGAPTVPSERKGG